MQAEKKSFKSKISFGLIILTPLVLVLYVAMKILKIFGEISYEVFWKYFYPNIFWLIAAFSGLFVYFFTAWFLGLIYHSKKTGLSRVVDSFMLNIPFVKYFWHAGRLKYKNQITDFSKVRAALIDFYDGVWKLVFITGKQKIEGGRSLAAALILSRETDKQSGETYIIMARGTEPTVPIPVTGFLDFIDEDKLRKQGRILYSKKPASELFKTFFSGGFIGPDTFEAES